MDEMNDIEEEMRLHRIVVGASVKIGIRSIGTAILILASALCVDANPLVALILAVCAHIYYRTLDNFFFSFTGTGVKATEGIKNRIKEIISSVVAWIVIFIICLALNYLLESEKAKEVLSVVVKAVTAICIFPLVVPVLPNDKLNDKSYSYGWAFSKSQSVSMKLFTVFSRLFIVVGFILTIVLKNYYNFYFEAIIIVGCVLLMARYVLICYCRVNCTYVYESDGQSEELYREEASTDGSGKVLNEHEVKKIVEKIANRWTGRGDTFFMVAGVSIKYSVTGEVTGGSFINFTVSGRLSGVRDNNRSEALTYARSKLDGVAQKIKMDALSELGKKNLPYSYDISVNIGYIQ